MQNRGEQDYIKAIYELTVERNQDLIKTTELAEYFNYSDQSVNEMIKRLALKELVIFYPYKGVELLEKGKKIAVKMIRAHRLWEVFLTQELNIPWEDSHDDAEKLEHATSEEVLNKLDSYLGFPKYCMHGNPIPNKEGKISPVYHNDLLKFRENDHLIIKRVLDVKDLIIFLNNENIKIENKVKILKKDDFNQVLNLEVNKKEIVISYGTAKMIFVEKEVI